MIRRHVRMDWLLLVVAVAVTLAGCPRGGGAGGY
jgi:hypothetical protein